MTTTARRPRILIVDDQDALRTSLADWLGADYDVQGVASGEDALEKLRHEAFELMLLDQRLPRMSGMDVLRTVAARYPSVAVVMMTAFGSVDQAVEATKSGAADYLLKPVDLDALQHRIAKILSYSALAEENQVLRRQLDEKYAYHNIITGDPVMKEICDRIEIVSRSDAPVLIVGESGTGKELVARAVHQASDRAKAPFVPVPCGAIPDSLFESELFGHEKGAFTGATERRIGRFEEAGQGTTFLDEIGELTPQVQVKLLRVLQERDFRRVGGSTPIVYGARLVSATNRNLEEAIETNEFRQDLLYRINTIVLELPPLRTRSCDIVLLAQHFLEQFAKRYSKPHLTQIQPEAIAMLKGYAWPGNVRQLRGLIEQAVILSRGSAISTAELPEHLRRGAGRGDVSSDGTFHQQMHDHGRRTIMEALDHAGGFKREAAKALGLSQRALSHYLKKYGITS